MAIADADGKVLHWYHITPIGGIIAWAKSFTNCPALGEGWVECNGQEISDAESPFNGETAPDLNSSLGAGLKGRFLRGHSSSGETESSQNLAHTHTAITGTGSNAGPGGTREQLGTYDTGSSGGTEARPSNYSVVWIMRIK
jgi:hypothetical protein